MTPEHTALVWYYLLHHRTIEYKSAKDQNTPCAQYSLFGASAAFSQPESDSHPQAHVFWRIQRERWGKEPGQGWEHAIVTFIAKIKFIFIKSIQRQVWCYQILLRGCAISGRCFNFIGISAQTCNLLYNYETSRLPSTNMYDLWHAGNKLNLWFDKTFEMRTISNHNGHLKKKIIGPKRVVQTFTAISILTSLSPCDCVCADQSARTQSAGFI